MAFEFLKKFASATPRLAPIVAPAPAPAPVLRVESPPVTQLRRGMWLWVTAPEAMPAVGILTDFHPTGEASVHLVDANGETVQSVTVAPQWVAQASLAQIPERRRPGPAMADKFGYK